MHEGKGQEVKDRCGVQPAVQHDGSGFELEDIARQCGMTRETILRDMEGKSIPTHAEKIQNCANNKIQDRYSRSRINKTS